LFKSNKWTPPFACLSTVAGRSGPAAQCPKGVKLRRTQYEHMFSGLPLIADIGVWHLSDGGKTPGLSMGVTPSHAVR
jgi:hypothetical protein